MKEKILYLSYTGLMEPLGQSQVLAYLTRLSRDFSVTLVTYEKPLDYKNSYAREKLHAECQLHGIKWLPRVYHKSPRLFATGYDLFLLLWDILRLGYCEKVSLIHCRGYITAIAAWLMSKMFGCPFIFDMRALWPEEMILSGTLKRGSVMHKLLSWFEVRLLRDAAAVVSLTSAAVFYLKNKYTEISKQKFTVIPTCVDLNRFAVVPVNSFSPTIIGAMGTVTSGWYHLNWLFQLYRLALDEESDAVIKIVTRDDRHVIERSATSAGINSEKIVFDVAKPAEVAAKISDMSFGVLFFAVGVGKIGSAPTRMGEFLACGIPVMGNRGVGDMADLIEHYGVGVVVENDSFESLQKAFCEIRELIRDPEIRVRCRAAAESYFSADIGAEKYKLVYQNICQSSPASKL